LPRKHAGGRSYGFAYDPAGRLHEVTASGLASRSYAWDGNDAIVTYANGQFLARTVYGPGENEPLYQVDNQGRRTWFAHDERGSIVGSSDTAGHGGARKAYDEYGNSSNFAYQHGYTGALHLRGTGLYYMRARLYDPKLGRFLQPDPIGYGDGLNMYAYVGGDPVNGSDPSGTFALLQEEELGDQFMPDDSIIVTGQRRKAVVVVGSASGPATRLRFDRDAVDPCTGGLAILTDNPRCADLPLMQLASGPKDPKRFVSPTNPPQWPRTQGPPTFRGGAWRAPGPRGTEYRFMPPTPQYPNGYWRQFNSSGQAIDPSTGRPPANVTREEARARTHVGFPEPWSPPSPVMQRIPPLAGAALLLYFLGIIGPAPLN
jgi:RHS repeat-associated protein